MENPSAHLAQLFTKMNKKSQIQIGETISVLFVFFILIAIGFIFYVRIIKGNLESQKDELSQLNSVGISQRVMFLPEIECSEDVVFEVHDCFDILKLNAAQTVMKLSSNALYYYDLLEFSNLSISEIYPDKTQKWTIYSRKPQNPQDFKNKFVTNVPVSLYDPLTRRRAFGVLTIETLSK